MKINKLFQFNFDLSFIKVTVLSLAIFFLAGVDTSYAMPSEYLNENDFSLNLLADFSASTSFLEKSQNQSVAGIWNFRNYLYGVSCDGEFIFHPNGTYTSSSSCQGSYPVYIAGNWRYLKKGVIRFVPTDYSPKENNGMKIPPPTPATVSYRFVNANQIQFSNGQTFYRAG